MVQKRFHYTYHVSYVSHAQYKTQYNCEAAGSLPRSPTWILKQVWLLQFICIRKKYQVAGNLEAVAVRLSEKK